MSIYFSKDFNLPTLLGTKQNNGEIPQNNGTKVTFFDIYKFPDPKKENNGTKVTAATDFEKGSAARRAIGEKAKEKLDAIKASNGITYKEAKAKMKEIEDKYFAMSKDDLWGQESNPYLKRVQDKDKYKTDGGSTLWIYAFHYEINEDVLPEPDKTEYRRAKAAVEEIERNYSALVSDAKGVFNFNIRGLIG